MAYTGTRLPSSSTDDTSVGTFAWTDKGNAGSEDGTLVTLGSNGQSYYGVWTNFGFTYGGGGDIPDLSSTIDGLEFVIKANRSSPASAGGLVSVKVVIGGVITGSEQGTISLTGTLTNYTVGGPTNKLGTSPTASDIVGTGFGIAISGNGTIMGRAQIDSIKCTVYYTAPASGRASLVSRSILVNGTNSLNGLVR